MAATIVLIILSAVPMFFCIIVSVDSQNYDEKVFAPVSKFSAGYDLCHIYRYEQGLILKQELKSMADQNDKSSPMVKTFRKDFIKGTLSEEEMSADPVKQFSRWLDFAFESGNEYANAMTLSTVDLNGAPSSRVMLLRDVSHGGLTFFTNYKSNKANDLKINPNASMLFFWPELERQVRIGGFIELLPAKDSDEYFESRPFESQVGATISSQSKVIKGRKEMDEAFARQLEFYKGKKVPRPDYWGGYVLIPETFEFWQGRANRLHDRFQYTKEEAHWLMERLMP